MGTQLNNMDEIKFYLHYENGGISEILHGILKAKGSCEGVLYIYKKLFVEEIHCIGELNLAKKYEIMNKSNYFIKIITHIYLSKALKNEK